MSFLDDIVDVGSSAWDWATGSSMSAGVARAAALAYMLKEVQNSINNDSSKSSSSTSKGSREQVNPDTTAVIPVVYGSAFVPGLITDAAITTDNQTMWYCLVVSEKTGKLMEANVDSVITFNRVYWDEQEVNFNSDGKTVASFTAADGTKSTDPAGLIEMYFYNNGSTNQTALSGFSLNNAEPAYLKFPNWTSSHLMSELAFVLVKVTYSSDKKITGLGNLTFKITNTLTQPGDCVYDLMTNTRYGAGFDITEIYSE